MPLYTTRTPCASLVCQCAVAAPQAARLILRGVCISLVIDSTLSSLIV